MVQFLYRAPISGDEYLYKEVVKTMKTVIFAFLAMLCLTSCTNNTTASPNQDESHDIATELVTFTAPVAEAELAMIPLSEEKIKETTPLAEPSKDNEAGLLAKASNEEADIKTSHSTLSLPRHIQLDEIEGDFFFVKPGDTITIGDSIDYRFEHFQRVQISRLDDSLEMSGRTADQGDWRWCLQNNSGSYSSSIIGSAPFEICDSKGTASQSITTYSESTNFGNIIIEAKTISAVFEEGCIYLSSPEADWGAIILDATRYTEISNCYNSILNYGLLASSFNQWIIGTPDTPFRLETTEIDIDTVAEKVRSTSGGGGVTNPKWPGIRWMEVATESWINQETVYTLSGNLGDSDTVQIRIMTDSPLGYSPLCEWTAVITQSSNINIDCQSCILYHNFEISIIEDNKALIVDKESGESRTVALDSYPKNRSEIAMITVSDGKHAQIINCRSEYFDIASALN